MFLARSKLSFRGLISGRKMPQSEVSLAIIFRSCYRAAMYQRWKEINKIACLCHLRFYAICYDAIK